uniref:G protein-coupled receptor n=1 Tax=Angiostrongylus cantonensis TaxID=6313 RepID=A0A0K0CTP1_ANGCA
MYCTMVHYAFNTSVRRDIPRAQTQSFWNSLISLQSLHPFFCQLNIRNLKFYCERKACKDGGFDRQPYLMFVLFAISDVLYVSSIIWSIISASTFTRPQNYRHVYNFLYLHYDKIVQLVSFLLKITFECFLFAKIVLLKDVSLLMLLSPLYLILTIVLVDLSKRLYSMQK